MDARMHKAIRGTIGFCLVVAAPVVGFTQDSPKLALHLGPAAAKNVCESAPANCATYKTQGELFTEYTAYIIATNIPEEGLAGIDFALAYDANLDVSGSVQCSDYTYASEGWPESGSGIVATWLHNTNCQNTPSPYAEDGILAPVVALSVYAYGNAKLQLFPNANDSVVEWTGCQATRGPIDMTDTGILAFGDSTGCNPCIEPCQHTPSYTIEPSTLYFEAIPGRRSDQGGYTIRNTSSVPIKFNVDIPCPEFSVRGVYPVFVLQPFQEKKLRIGYTPANIGRDVCEVPIGPLGKSLTLIGKGIYTCRVYADSMWFGSVTVGESRSFNFTFERQGTFDLDIQPTCSDFKAELLYGIDISGREQIRVTFSPTTAGEHDCLITFGGPEYCKNVPVRGIAYDHLTFPDTLIFGGDLAQGEFLTLPVTVRNRGAAVDCNPTSSCANFTVTPPGPFTIPENGEQILLVTFQPSDYGDHECTIDLGTYDGSTFQVTGFCQTPCTVYPNYIDFGEVLLGDTAHGTIRISTLGIPFEGFIAGSCSTVFVENGGPFQLAADQDRTFIVSFRPNHLGPDTCYVTTSSCQDVMVTGIGTSPVPVDFVSIQALRTAEGAVISWSATETSTRSSFLVFREDNQGQRRAITSEPLSGRYEYQVLDPNPPQESTLYWIQELGHTGILWHGPVHLPVLSQLAILRAVPNPFSSRTEIHFTSPPGHVSLSVFNVSGRELWRSGNHFSDSGEHVMTWDGTSASGDLLPVGIYFYRISQDGRAQTGKVIRAHR